MYETIMNQIRNDIFLTKKVYLKKKEKNTQFVYLKMNCVTNANMRIMLYVINCFDIKRCLIYLIIPFILLL